MITQITDHVRCENHAGEPFPPRCADCVAAAIEYEEEQRESRHQAALERQAALAADKPRGAVSVHAGRR